jgi:hypothetical protein
MPYIGMDDDTDVPYSCSIVGISDIVYEASGSVYTEWWDFPTVQLQSSLDTW